MRIVAFAMNSSEVKYLKSRYDISRITLIALAPEAVAAFENYSIEYKTIEDYYCFEKLNNISCFNINNIQKLCEYLDLSYLHGNSADYFSFSEIFMLIKMVCDQLLINHTFCQNILDKEQPEKIITPKIIKLNVNFYTNNDDLLTNFIPYFFVSKHNIKCEHIENNFVKEERRTSFSLLFINKLKYLKWKMICALYRYRNKNEPAIYILQHHDFEICLRIRSIFKVYWEQIDNSNLENYDTYININYNALESRLLQDKKLNDFFSFNGIDYLQLIVVKIIFSIEHLSKKFDMLVKKYEDTFIRKNIKVVLAAAGQSLNILAGLKAASICGLPVIWGQHGGLYGYGDFPLTNFLYKHYTHYLLYAEGVSDISNGKPFACIGRSNLINIFKCR